MNPLFVPLGFFKTSVFQTNKTYSRYEVECDLQQTFATGNTKGNIC